MANDAKSYFELWLDEKIDSRRERAKTECVGLDRTAAAQKWYYDGKRIVATTGIVTAIFKPLIDKILDKAVARAPQSERVEMASKALLGFFDELNAFVIQAVSSQSRGKVLKIENSRTVTDALALTNKVRRQLIVKIEGAKQSAKDAAASPINSKTEVRIAIERAVDKVDREKAPEPIISDQDLHALIGHFTYDKLASRRRNASASFSASVVALWNEQTGDNWAPQADEVAPHDEKTFAVGWFLYQRARMEMNPNHAWASSFDANARFDLGSDLGRPITVSELLSAEDLELIERRARTKLLSKVLLSHTADILVQLPEVEARGGVKLFLLDEMTLPNRAWMNLSETVLTLVNGKFESVTNLQDLATVAPSWMPPDLADVAERMIFELAYQEALDIHAIPDGGKEAVKVASHSLRPLPSIFWASDRFKLEDGRNYQKARIRTETFATWLRSRFPTAPQHPAAPVFQSADIAPATARPAHRPTEFPWEEKFDQIVRNRFEEEGDFDKRLDRTWYRDAAILKMQGWCAEQVEHGKWVKAPSRSAIRDRIDRIRDEFRASRASITDGKTERH